MSEYGIGRWKDIRDDDRQGTGAKGLAASGSLTENHLLSVDANGNAVDSGVLKTNAGLLQMGFRIAWDGGTATGTDIAGHRLISQDCVPVSITVRAKTAPAASNYSIDVHYVRESDSPVTDETILASAIVLTAGSVLATGTLAEVTFEAGDYLTISASQSGGTAPENVFVEILVRLS